MARITLVVVIWCCMFSTSANAQNHFKISALGGISKVHIRNPTANLTLIEIDYQPSTGINLAYIAHPLKNRNILATASAGFNYLSTQNSFKDDSSGGPHGNWVFNSRTQINTFNSNISAGIGYSFNKFSFLVAASGGYNFGETSKIKYNERFGGNYKETIIKFGDGNQINDYIFGYGFTLTYSFGEHLNIEGRYARSFSQFFVITRPDLNPEYRSRIEVINLGLSYKL